MTSNALNTSKSWDRIRKGGKGGKGTTSAQPPQKGTTFKRFPPKKNEKPNAQVGKMRCSPNRNRSFLLKMALLVFLKLSVRMLVHSSGGFFVLGNEAEAWSRQVANCQYGLSQWKGIARAAQPTSTSRILNGQATPKNEARNRSELDTTRCWTESFGSSTYE